MGREVELAYAVANVLGMEIEIRPMKWAECLKLAGEHKVDLVLTCAEYATDCEADDLLFSIPDGADEYMVFGREPLGSLKELGKRRLAQMSFGNVNPTLEAAGFASEMKLYPSNREAFLAVERGEADYIVIRHTPAIGILKELGLKGIKPQCSAGRSCFCIGVNRQKPELLRKVNDAIMVLRVSGETRRLSEKWLSTYVEPDTLAELVAKSPQAFIGFLALVMLLAVILVWNVSLRVLAERRGRALFKARIGNATAKLKVEERTHLAIELHDTIAQNLTGVSMELASAADLGEGASPEMLHHLGIATKALKSCRDELRYCLFDLRNQALEEPNFATAVERTLQPHLNGAKLSVRFNVPRKELHDNTAQALLRAIRELAVNAIRHGKATSIKVAGELDADGLRCSVRDDGCGFDPDTCPGVLQGHFGLQGVRERIEGLGGSFDIASAPGKGTKAVITIRPPKVTDEEST